MTLLGQLILEVIDFIAVNSTHATKAKIMPNNR
jgi:hypothetical protein